MNEEISICMLAYNHARWIRQAIMSILNQNIDKKIKIYIFDDASTDGTSDIILELAEMYSDIIVPLVQKENVFSKYGYNGISRVIKENIKGKYVCICEGDDYWLDMNKLSKQYEYMVSHPLCTFCFSNAIMVDGEGKYLNNFYKKYFWKDKTIAKKLFMDSDFNTDEMLRIGFTPTASSFFTYDAYMECTVFPIWLDLSMRLVATDCGYAHYFHEAMTAYRVGNSESASGRASENFEKYLEDFNGMHTNIYDEFDKYTKGRYSETIDVIRNREMVQAYIRFLNRDNYIELVHLNAYKDLTVSKKIKYFFKYLGKLFKVI